MKEILVTHRGPFHADDLFTYSVLAFIFRNHTLIRTRDPKVIETGTQVFDVGGAYQPERQRYDHHFKPVPARPDGRLFSSFGLVWKHHGMEFLRVLFLRVVDENTIQAVHHRMDERFVSQIDATDNGMGLEPRDSDASTFLETFNPPYDVAQEEEDAAFVLASTIAGSIFSQSCIAALREVQAISQFKAQAQRITDEILIFEGTSRTEAWISILQKDPEYALVKFVIYLEGEDGWRCRTIPQPENCYVPRKAFPASWAGKRDSELQHVSGILSATFCHPAAFIAGAKVKVDAIEMANIALKS
jgi:uncharacterized UPF0160 family protein